MKIILFLFFLVILASCGNGSADNLNAGSVTHDSSFSGAVISDSTGASEMNADTSGMRQAR